MEGPLTGTLVFNLPHELRFAPLAEQTAALYSTDKCAGAQEICIKLVQLEISPPSLTLISSD